MTEDQQKEDQPHVGKKLAFRRKLLRMQAQTATAKNWHAGAADRELDEFIESCMQDTPTDGDWDESWAEVAVEQVPATWIGERGYLARDMSEPLEIYHPNLRRIHEQQCLTSVGSCLYWIRSHVNANTVDDMYKALQIRPDAIALVYFLSLYLEILDGVDETHYTIDFDGAVSAAGGGSRLLEELQYGRALYNPSWSIHPDMADDEEGDGV